jgi:hypothetical protein
VARRFDSIRFVAHRFVPFVATRDAPAPRGCELVKRRAFFVAQSLKLDDSIIGRRAGECAALLYG